MRGLWAFFLPTSASWLVALQGESCTDACNRTGATCQVESMDAVMTACPADSWRLLNSLWSSAGDSSISCSENFTQGTLGPYYDGECSVSPSGTSCNASPSASSRRLCCCAATCAYDAGYCAEGYVPGSGDTTDDTNIEELQTVGWIAGFGVGLCFVLSLGIGCMLGRHLMYDRVKKKALKKLKHASTQRTDGDGDGEDFEVSEDEDMETDMPVPADIMKSEETMKGEASTHV